MKSVMFALVHHFDAHRFTAVWPLAAPKNAVATDHPMIASTILRRSAAFRTAAPKIITATATTHVPASYHSSSMLLSEAFATVERAPLCSLSEAEQMTRDMTRQFVKQYLPREKVAKMDKDAKMDPDLIKEYVCVLG